MLVAKSLKKIENVDIYNYSTNFNPFKFGLDNKTEQRLNLGDKSIL
jgi:hypothetical protein